MRVARLLAMQMCRALSVSACVSVLTLSGCNPGGSAKVVVAPQEDGAAEMTEEAATPELSVEPTIMEVRMHLREINKTLDFAVELVKTTTEEVGAFEKSHPDPNAEAPPEEAADEEPLSRAGLLNGASMMLTMSGFGPGLLDTLDLDGRHDLYARFAGDEDIPEDAVEDHLAVSFTTTSNEKLIQSFPAAAAPQPLGEGRWSLGMEGQPTLLQEDAGAILLGLNEEDLGIAQGRRDETPPPWSYWLRVDLEAPEGGEGGGIWDDLPSGPASEYLSDLEWAEFGMQFDHEHGIVMEIGFDPSDEMADHQAPPSGPYEAAPPITSKFPADLLAASISRSAGGTFNSKSVRESIAEIDEEAAWARDLFLSISEDLDAAIGTQEHDVMAFLWTDPKGKVAMGFAIDNPEPKKLRAKFGKMMTDFQKAAREEVQRMETEAVKEGRPDKRDNDKADFTGTFRADGLTLAGQKSDQFSLAITGVDDIDLLVRLGLVADKGEKGHEFEIVIADDKDTAYFIAGPGAQALTTEVLRGKSKARKDGGWSPVAEQALRTFGPSTIVGSFDLTAVLRTMLRSIELDGKDKTKDRKERDAMLKTLQKTDRLQILGGSTLRSDEVRAGLHIGAEQMLGKDSALRYLLRGALLFAHLYADEETAEVDEAMKQARAG